MDQLALSVLRPSVILLGYLQLIAWIAFLIFLFLALIKKTQRKKFAWCAVVSFMIAVLAYIIPGMIAGETF